MTASPISIWATRWNIPPDAVDELSAIVGARLEPTATPNTSGEARVQSLMRLDAARRGGRLFRNNVGVLKNAEGTPVRYGLGNDSPAVNKVLKSSDLIGWRTIVITSAMIGLRIAQFKARECKRPGWTYNPNDPHEAAQKRFLDLATLAGADARFTTGNEL